MELLSYCSEICNTWSEAMKSFLLWSILEVTDSTSNTDIYASTEGNISQISQARGSLIAFSKESHAPLGRSLPPSLSLPPLVLLHQEKRLHLGRQQPDFSVSWLLCDQFTRYKQMMMQMLKTARYYSVKKDSYRILTAPPLRSLHTESQCEIRVTLSHHTWTHR